MPRAKPFDKKTATTYALVNRPQHDPLIHDPDAPSQIFAEIPSSSKQDAGSKIKHRKDLEQELNLEGSIRQNEGEAAEHGIYFDDSNYDYMQHLRELGGSTDATWLESSSHLDTLNKDKSKISLEDALRQSSLNESGVIESLAESRDIQPASLRQRYENQQNVPDALAGFQPDMDWRLREVLEALEDDAYVDDEDDIFVELAADGSEEIDPIEWETNQYADYEDDDYDEAWESDDTTKPINEYSRAVESQPSVKNDSRAIETPANLDPADDGSWLASFTKSKGLDDVPRFQTRDSSHTPLNPSKMPIHSEVAPSAALTSASQFSRRKKRKGALTSSTGFSMSSSALARTEPLSTLDSRFDKIAESYFEDGLDEDDDDLNLDDNSSVATGMSARTGMSKASFFSSSQASEAPSLAPARFNSILDDFLGDDSGKQKGRAMKKAGRQGRWGVQTGMEQLDEIRKGLGPARINAGRT